MITEKHGDILSEPWDTWVCIPVNCRGVAGAGLARQWKDRYPLANAEYVKLCRDGLMQPGRIWWMMREEGCFILAATKDHWRDPSRIEWIESIAEDLADRLTLADGELELAIPMLGAGLGGLAVDQVRDLLWYWLMDHTGDGRLDRHTITLYLP